MINLPQLLAIVVSILIAVGIFLVWAFTHLEQLGILLTWIYRLLSWANRRIRLRAITSQIQSKINVGAESIESQVQGVMPHPLKIDWIGRQGEEYAQLKDGQIVVRIRNEFDNARNITTATILYLQEGLLRESRPYIDQKLLQALDLNIAWKLIAEDEESEVAYYFLNRVFNPTVDSDPEIASDCEKIDAMDSTGVMTRVFMRELRGVGRRAIDSQEKPTRELKGETRSFADFLYTIVTSERGAVYPLNFVGRKIRAGILLVASFETLAMYGLRVHKRWFRKKNEMGVETVYVLAFGPKNVNLAQHLAQWAQNEGLVEIVRRQPFVAPAKSGRAERTVVITCHSTQAKADTLLDPEEELQVTLVRWIPEVATGDVEVLDIAREPGIQSKVIVRSVVGRKDPMLACIGPNGERLRKVRAELNESVWFIAFSEDPEIFLIDCLGIPHEGVHSVQIDFQGKQADILVEDREIAAMAIGSKGVNVRLASQITGLHIQILTVDQAESLQSPQPAKSPEELLKQALVEEISEVASGDIAVVDMVREPGAQSKVVVRHTSDQERAVPICVGPNKVHIKALVDKLGESIWFVEFHEDPEAFLVACLGVYPDRVFSVNINPNLRIAKVLVTDSVTCARAIGENGTNAKQAAQLTGLRYISVQPQE